MIAKAPLRFRPYLKSVIWGGDRICNYKGIRQPEPNIGESWEISAVPGHESVVDGGVYDGLSIRELIEVFGASLLGDDVYERYGGNFPLLIKFIDANDNLSVQVHPDDRLAEERHGSMGKTEMWYIIEAGEEARIYAGLQMELTPAEYERRVSENRFMEALAVHESNPGDVFFLPAGRIHAIGTGNLLAEIQESSDITYRIYDYDRRDKDGNPRELHTQLAKDAIDYRVHPEYKNPPVNEDEEYTQLVSCEHFSTFRLKVKGGTSLSFDTQSFTVVMCVEGDVKLKYALGEMELKSGQTLLLPAVLSNIEFEGDAILLISRS